MGLSSLILPAEYHSLLNILETEIAIKTVKDNFERNLANNLQLTRVSAPLFVNAVSGINDDLNGIERPVEFDILETKEDVQIVQSLAKWKRLALKRYGFEHGKGLYTDMNAIRRDEELDNLHSVYVDQWDWEKIITEEERNLITLKDTVKRIVKALKESENHLIAAFPQMKPFICEDVFFITSQELEDMYPELTPKQREDAICKLHKTVFVMQIGGLLKSGQKHDGRAPDYDDWNLNGDILIWYPILDRAIEISSMGIRVSPESLDKQLNESNCNARRSLEFHKQLLNGELPFTMGGGIGQSRICMVLLQKAHIGEVQASTWSNEMIEACANHGITLL
ncbi:aspartate--ammonia ligase [Paludicola sp. MB14-C6]|uniref:aspartate--ammonia ligase n=1 Tax=Paludihabitans sp. MB14-C6 TaxID=3070656 RepID=UPI0027DE951F|nr:aspartate--ammonia ligase [Paludicola sp. MB14-C6]WMJ23881.1 aspartate--ammonia ligase [Paludicola sp. MB14-C6]